MSMKDEMTDEWFDLAITNIDKLIPSDWMPKINEILPHLLKIAKIGITKNIKVSAEQLGDTKMFITMNYPHAINDGDVIMVPTMFRVDKRQLGPSVLNEETGIWDFRLKEGEEPELTFSMLTLAEKINSYTSIEQLIKDMKNGTFMTLADLKYSGTYEEKQKMLGEGQKQIQQPNNNE